MDVNCADCNVIVPRTSNAQKYCHSCSMERKRASVRMWHNKNRSQKYEVDKRYTTSDKGRIARSARETKRRAHKLGATPAWADLSEIKYVYTLAQERGLVVDHIVPLVSPFVCGLHTQDNLRCITNEWNARKSNRYWADM